MKLAIPPPNLTHRTIMAVRHQKANSETPFELPVLRYEIEEAARMLRMSRAQLYIRIGEGLIRPQKDGARTYITRSELDRYVSICEKSRRSDSESV